MKIRLIRHAESTWNALGDTSNNVPTTENGKNQAKNLSGEYDLVVCSTLRRARETIDNSNIKYKKIIFTDLCREHFDGNPSNYFSLEEHKKESQEELLQRTEEFKCFVGKLMKDNYKICVITHYGFLQKMTGFRFNNCFWYDYTIENKYIS